MVPMLRRSARVAICWAEAELASAATPRARHALHRALDLLEKVSVPWSNASFRAGVASGLGPNNNNSRRIRSSSGSMRRRRKGGRKGGGEPQPQLQPQLRQEKVGEEGNDDKDDDNKKKKETRRNGGPIWPWDKETVHMAPVDDQDENQEQDWDYTEDEY